ncbi:MAG: DUF3386 family protein [Nitrospirae bacterium]|nr:DUF3386 family protein [Nitrospirota bacterium]MBI3352103.1 DUF3386 family protein [Nitrospirota bacterium]
MKNYEVNEQETIAVADDPQARDLLRRAYETTYRWSQEFKGFSSSLEVTLNGKSVKGSVTVRLPEEVKVSLGDPEIEKWAEAQIGMMATHRGHRTFDTSDGKNILTLGEADSHPLGRLVLIHGDGLNSRYRVKDNRIVQINRNMGPVRFTINVQDSIITRDGKFLNTRYIVYYFTPKGDLKQAESFNDEPVVVNGVYLPGKRRVFFSEGGEACVKELLFSNHLLL